LRFHSTRLFDWNAAEDRYIGGEATIAYENSSGCALRLAHLALKDSNYATAVEEYEQALQQTVTDTDNEFNQYIRLRLVSAYALNNQDASAISLLEELVGETPTTTLMDTMINSAYAAYYESRNPIALCASLYQSLGVGKDMVK
jgi:lipopolysaccharide biosynthesis regulator YciM